MLAFRDRYDVNLALRPGIRIVGNHRDADDKSLIVITGANQGGKSTYLRAVGIAQLMMQSGMFVPPLPTRQTPAPGSTPITSAKKTPP